jgi:2-keto-4-pentenoate hydratase/2-oxohepta-3-ene-1,7-dioic acid hydratase in catechol pathway
VNLLRIGPSGREVPAARTADGELRDLRPLTTDIDGAFLADRGVERARDALATLPVLEVEAGTRIGAPIARPSAIVCIGLNYADHATETGAPVPAEPVVFAKATSTLTGPNDPILLPPGSTTTDYEVELAVVIGRAAHRLASPDEALAVVAGYAIANDVSERELQLERGGGQWYLGKSCPTFNPLGPWLVPAEDVPDLQALALTLRVNGELRQSSSTGQMIFGVAHLVWYLSQHLHLEPGDVINTGTPAGVALGRPGTPYLQAGDVVEVSIEGLGTQRQEVVAS